MHGPKVAKLQHLIISLIHKPWGRTCGPINEIFRKTSHNIITFLSCSCSLQKILHFKICRNVVGFFRLRRPSNTRSLNVNKNWLFNSMFLVIVSSYSQFRRLYDNTKFYFKIMKWGLIHNSFDFTVIYCYLRFFIWFLEKFFGF